MKKHYYSIGDLVWMNGVEYRVEAPKPTTQIMFVSPVSSQGLGDDVKAVHPGNVEPLVTTQFSIGQQVKSFHTFVGEVTGFEKDTNRAVCRSQYHKPNESRQRYAYRINELEVVRSKSYCQEEKTKDTTERESSTSSSAGRYILTTRQGDSYLVEIEPFMSVGTRRFNIVEVESGTCVLIINSIDDPEILRRQGVLKLFKV